MPQYDWLKPTSPTNVPQASAGIVGWLRNRFGYFPGNKEVAKDKSPEGQLNSLEKQQVSSGPRNIVIPWYPPYNTYLDRQQGYSAEMQEAFRLMMADSNVKAAITTQILGVAALDLQIRPAINGNTRDEEIADFNRYVFTECLEGGFVSLAWNIFSGGMIDGYSINEELYSPEEHGDWAGKILLTGLKPKDVGNDVVILTDNFRNIVGLQGLRYNAGENFDPARFTIFRYQPLYDSPVGQSALRAAYRPWWCLRAANALRTVFLERRATPVVWGTYANSTQKPSLDAGLAALQSRNWMSAPEGVRAEVLNVAGSADEAFASAVKDYKHEIFLAIQAASLPNIEGTVSDGRGNTKVQQGQADLFKWYLSQCMLSILNDRKCGLIRKVTDLNYVTPRYPKATLSAVDQDEVAAELRNYFTGWQMGLDFSKSEIYDKFGWKPPTDPGDCLSGKPASSGGSGGPGGPGGMMPTGPDDGGDPNQPAQMSDTQAVEVPGFETFRVNKVWGNWLRGNSKTA